MITFQTVSEPSALNVKKQWIHLKAGSTPLRVAANLNHPEWASVIAKNAGVRSTTTKLKEGQRIQVPTQSAGNSFNVLCDDLPPQITDGYAQYEIVARPGRTGVNKFDGFNPIVMALNIRFEAYLSQDGSGVEAAIGRLERMAGRGAFAGSGHGPPAIVAITTTNDKGHVVPLIPAIYQSTGPSSPLWRITGLAWDNTAGQVLRDKQARRIRQLCVVTATEYTPISLITRSVAVRARAAAATAKNLDPTRGVTGTVNASSTTVGSVNAAGRNLGPVSGHT